MALLKYGSVALALLAVPYPAVAQSAAELRAEIEALRKENASLRERDRLAKQNSALHKRLAPSAPATGAQRATSSAREPNPLQAHAADMPVKALAPAPVVALPNWAGFYIGGGVSREQRKTSQGTVTITTSPIPPASTNPSMTRTLDLEQFASAGHVLGGWLWQYNRLIVGVEGDYYFGGQTSKDPRYLVPALCDGGVISTGNFGCGSGAAFGSFQTRGHVRGIAGWEFTPRFMGFLAGGLAIGDLGAGGIQVGGIIVDSPALTSAGSISSSYAGKTLFGWSWGGGVQAKLNESLVGRLEYLRDEYDGPGQVSRAFTNTSGASSVTATSNPQNIRIVNQALRGSLIYRFDPNGSFYDAATRDFAAFGQWQNSGNGFAGFYVGVGVSQNNYDYRMENATTLSINDSNTPGVDISEVRDSFLQGGKVAKNFVLGYRYQFARFLVGAEREFVRGSRKDLEKAVGTIGFAGSGRDFTCYEQFSPDIVCLGLDTTIGSVETRGRLRAIGGVEITPSLMAFVGYGWAYGRASGTSGSSQGIVQDDGGGAPLVGAATVSRRQSNDITGHTFGGGIEIKATEQIFFRADYWRDHYTWNAIVCGGAGFGGTIGNITVNSFNTCKTPVVIRTEAFQASVIYRFWNPQGSGGGAGAVSPLLALAGAVGSPLAAFAKAGPVYKARPGAVPVGYSWTGFYAGAHAGWGWGHQNWTGVEGGVFPEGSFNSKGWLAGAQVGYNYQVNQWVLGIEVDGDFTDMVGQRISLDPATGQDAVIKVEVEGTVTVAGRLGWAVNNYLFYGKGGAAFVRNHVHYTDNGAGNAHEWKGGWMVGGGAEYGITPSISAKLEYDYMDFGTRGYDILNCQTSCFENVNLKQNIHVVKAGLNWRFWNPGPLVARY